MLRPAHHDAVTSEQSFQDIDAMAVSGGRISGMAAPAFHLIEAEFAQIPVLIAAPHGGRHYPDGVTANMRQGHLAQLRLEDRLVDLLARGIVQQCGAAMLIADAPRAIIDLNRAPDDVDWEMIAGTDKRNTRHSAANRRSRHGLGLIPRRLSGMGEIWRDRIDAAELESRIENIHRPYHRALSETLEALRDRWGAVLLIDLHSMPPLPRKFPDDRPAEMVVGDRFGASCDDQLVAATLQFLDGAGRLVAHNRPYSGGYVLDRHAAPVRGIHAMQIEVCRSLYLDQRFEAPSIRLPAITRLLTRLILSLAYQVEAMGREGRLPQAAE